MATNTPAQSVSTNTQAVLTAIFNSIKGPNGSVNLAALQDDNFFKQLVAKMPSLGPALSDPHGREKIINAVRILALPSPVHNASRFLP
jgi:hypothetical protein